MAKGSRTPIITKKHLARVERERRQNRMILISSIAVILIVIGVLSYGYVQKRIIEPRQPVAKIGDDIITTREFQVYARYNRFQLVQQYAQYVSFAQMFGGADANTQSYLTQYWAQANYQLDPEVLGQKTIDELVNFSLVRQYAEENNITISPERLDQVVQEFFSYYPAGTPTVEPTRQILPTSTLSPTQLALFPPTATPVITGTEGLTPTATLAPTATFTPTPTASAPTATAQPSATPTEYTQALYEENYNQYVDYLRNNIGLTGDDLRWIFEMQLYYQEVFDLITADVPAEQDQVWARTIVVADEATAQEVLTRLENGEDFTTLAAELSTDSATAAKGGDMGWFGIGIVDPQVEKIAFNLGIGQFSQPIQTAAGYQIIQVLGHEVRQLTDAELDAARNSAFQIWLDSQKQSRQVEIYDLWVDRVPTIPTLPPLP
jgi:parvulin-like peptidyl-prolyl isomerase